MAYEFLKKLFGANEDGTPKALTYAELEAAIDADKKIKLADLSAGGYVSKEKLDAKVTELDGVKQQLADAHSEIQSYKDMDIDGIKKKAEEWEAKYTADTQALNDKLAAQERQHQEERYFDQYQFTSTPARRGVLDEFQKKGFALEDGKFLGADEFMKGLMEDENYKGAFAIKEEGQKSGQQQPTGQEPIAGRKPYFSAGTSSQTQEPKGSTFGFHFSGVRKHG